VIDPRTTNIVGQRVLIVDRAAPPRTTYGRGVVRVVDYQHGVFAFLIEALGPISCFGVGDGGLFQITTADETAEVIVDREAAGTP